MTKKQQAIVDAIRDYLAQHKYSPTIREVCKLVGLSSSGNIHRHLNLLKEKGVLTWEETKPRTLKILQ